MKIGTVSKETGLGIHAIRYYEKQGLINKPKKDTSGHRVYSPKDVELLDWVSCMKNSGMPLSKIREYSAAFYNDNGSACLTLLKDHLALLNEKKLDILHYVDVINAFVDGGRGGNPAGVVLDADALSNSQKLATAKKIGLSETAFVSSSDIADFKLDFFTPQKQIAHCGHATIATFSYLSSLGLVASANTSKETIDGIRSIQVDGDFAHMEQLAPKYSPLETDTGVILEALGITADDTTTEPLIVNTGNSFLLIGVKDIHQLNSIMPDQKLIEEISEKYDLIGFYVFTQVTNVAGRDASTRMFAPRYGISEESATGMAAGPLACFLHDQVGLKQERFTIEQGYSMQPASPSCIEVSLEVKDSAITSLLAGGVGAASRFEEVEI